MEKELKEIFKTKGGYKAHLEVELPDLVLNCSVKYETMNSKDVKENHKVVYKDNAGKEVVRKYIGESRHLEWRRKDDPGIAAEGSIAATQMRDGAEVIVAPFEKSDTIKILKIADKGIKENFLVEKTLELWGEEQGKLFKLAEYLRKNNKVGLCSIVMTRGYDTQYLGLLEPRFIQNKFGFCLFLTKKQIQFKHLLDSTAKAIETEKPVELEIMGVLV
jgi:hypothetical protein